MAFNIPAEKQEIKLSLENFELNRVKDFCYLGALSSSTKSDFERKKGLALGAWNKLENIWSAKYIQTALEIKIFEATVQSIFLYGCRTWIISPQLESQINVFATNCYRKIL